MDAQLIIVDAFHYNENNHHRFPRKMNSVDYENNHFELRTCIFSWAKLCPDET